MSHKKKEIEIKVVNNPNDNNEHLVQISDHTVGTIKQNGSNFDCVVGSHTFHEKNEQDALQQIVSEYNLHQR